MEMAQAFRFSRLKLLRHVVLPQLFPFIAAAGRSGLALIWKIVLVVELLGRSNGVGFQIHLYFQLFDVAAILGYALAFVCVMLFIEFVVVQPLETHVNLWRPGALARAARRQDRPHGLLPPRRRRAGGVARPPFPAQA